LFVKNEFQKITDLMISYAQNLTECFRLSRLFYHLIVDINGDIAYANPLCQEALRHHLPERRKNFRSIFAEIFKPAIQMSLDHASAIAIETAVPSMPGEELIITWELSAISDEDGRVENIQAIGVKKSPVLKDTPIKTVSKQREERFRKLTSSLHFGVIVRDANGKALLCNKEALRYADLSEEEFLKTTFPMRNVVFMREDGSILGDDHHPTMIAIRTKKHVRDVVLGVKKNRNFKWILTNAEPILDSEGTLLHVITTFTDITERKSLEQKLLQEEINRQKLITKATIEGQEKERKEIGAELHDNINQILTTTQLYLEIAESTADEATLEMIQLSSKTIRNAINEIRKLSRSLVPPALGELGLVESVKDLCDSLRTTQLFVLRFYHKNFNEDGLPETLKLTLFRIIQEQINNIVKYAAATSIRIRLMTDSDQIMLVISDNGKGFDLQRTRKGLGFSNIINRAELCHGKTEIRSAPDQGCTLIVAIPISKI
jgi:PAS domain S-box-containing protein